MKIKTKKQMNLPQLIEWAMNNDVRNKSFRGDRYDDVVHFDENKDLTCDYITVTEIFQVEVEETVTEDTVIPKALNVFKNTTNRIKNDEEFHIRRNVSVKEIKENSRDYIENDRLYIMNDDLTMTLIWRDGRLMG